MDLPPPSYEAATGIPGLHKQINPYLIRAPPRATPPQNNEITAAEHVSSLIPPQPFRPKTSPYHRPSNSYPLSSTPNVLLPSEEENKSEAYNWIRAIFAFIAFGIITHLLISLKSMF